MKIFEGCEVTGISRKKKHLDVAESLGAQRVFQFTESQEDFLKDVKNNYGLFDAAIVFAPADLVTDTAIKSVKKGELCTNKHLNYYAKK